MPAVLFGSISTVADTSELQRRAFNQAFAAHGLDWRWDQERYRAMLGTSGGRSRIADYARSLGQSVDAQAVHETKSAIFQQDLTGAHLEPRPGVLDTIAGARRAGWQVGLVTTTSAANIAALLDALGPAVRAEDFDVIVDAAGVAAPKPDRAAYVSALSSLGERAGDCVAIEDNADGIRAAVAAGVACVAFPNENTAGLDAGGAERRVDHLDADDLRLLIHGSAA